MSNHSVEERKVILGEEVEKMEKSLLREVSVVRELTNDTNALTAALALEGAGDPIDPTTGYESFKDWTDHLHKQLSTSERSLANMEIDKVILVALKYYIENAS